MKNKILIVGRQECDNDKESLLYIRCDKWKRFASIILISYGMLFIIKFLFCCLVIVAIRFNEQYLLLTVDLS